MPHLLVLSCTFEALSWCAFVRSLRFLDGELHADLKALIFCFVKSGELVLTDAVVRLSICSHKARTRSRNFLSEKYRPVRVLDR